MRIPKQPRGSAPADRPAAGRTAHGAAREPVTAAPRRPSRRRLFGRRAKRASGPRAGTAALCHGGRGGAPEASDEQSAADAESSEKAPPARRRKHPGRRPLPSDLPRERIEVAPAPADLLCRHCDTPKVRIGEDHTETLDYVPAVVHDPGVRARQVCLCELQQGVVQAALPARPIEKGRPGPGLLAHVVTCKYADHLPLYRLEAIFAPPRRRGDPAHAVRVERGGRRPAEADRRAMALREQVLRVAVDPV